MMQSSPKVTQLDSLSVDFIENHFLTPWDFGNEILYKLCADYPHHSDDAIIIAKTLFIGRIYAAAIERRRTKEGDLALGDTFYTETIVDAFKRSCIDDVFGKLANGEHKSIHMILEAHKTVVDILLEITGLEKRSFASKYLHFHFPYIFFIYDSRALSGIKKFIKKIPMQYSEFLDNRHVDLEYAKFYCKCHYLQCIVMNKYQKSPEKITPRIIDNMLLR